MAFYVNDNNEDAFYDAIYFDSFGVEHILKKIKKNHWKQKYHNKYLYKHTIR